MKPSSLLLALAFAGLISSPVTAKPVVRKVVGQTSVSNGGSSAELRTRSRSAGEVALDNGVVRAGSNTSLRATGDDSVMLDKGLAVVASKPRFFRPSVSVQTSAHRFQVRGTAQIYHEPGKPMRVVVIEGRMTISLQSLSREKITLRAGEMLIIDPVEPALPEPLDIDLDRLVSTAQLLAGREFEELPTRELVVRAAREQVEESRSSGGGVREASGGSIGGGGDAAIYARPEELVHLAIIDDIGDLDGDGEPDDLDDLDDFDEDDEDLDDEDLDDADEDADDDADDADGDGGDDPDPGDGGGGGDE